MRVRIERGSSSIEVDGDFEEVTKILDGWWLGGGEDHDVEAQAKPEPSTAKRARSKRTKNAERPPTDNAFDVQGTVNAVRNDPRFDIFRAKILVGEASRSQRAKFVSWFTHERPLTSGDIQRVLQGLGVKMDPPTASRAMSDAKDDYLKDVSRQPATFRLTERGHAEYEAWLLNGE